MHTYKLYYGILTYKYELKKYTETFSLKYNFFEITNVIFPTTTQKYVNTIVSYLIEIL
jgi:hypothetical protein